MGTRSNIARLNADGSVDVIYCHWDGYYEGVGSVLVSDYKTKESVDELISLGNRSSINKKEVYNEPSTHFENIEKWIEAIDGHWIEYIYLFIDKGIKNPITEMEADEPLWLASDMYNGNVDWWYARYLIKAQEIMKKISFYDIVDTLNLNNESGFTRFVERHCITVKDFISDEVLKLIKNEDQKTYLDAINRKINGAKLMDKQDSVTVHIAVMDYCSGSIKMYTKEFKKDWQADEDVEDWLTKYTDYSDSQCYYMASEKPIEIEYPNVDETEEDD